MTRYALGFTSLDQESSGIDLAVAGHMPAWLAGSLIRTAPAKFEVGKDRYRHWFDGLAMLHLFEFAGGQVRYTNRFIESNSYREAQEKQGIARGEFMTDPCRSLFDRVKAIFRPRPTDNTNVNVALLGGRLVALTESLLPIEFDPQTLETVGHFQYAFEPGNGGGGQVSTAHPHYDGERGYSYMIAMGRHSKYRLFVDEGDRQRVLTEIEVAQPAYMHSFGMSQRYLILTEFSLRVNPLRLLLGSEPFIRNYRWREEDGTVFSVVDKQSGELVARARAPACFAFHHVNAFERDGMLYVDILTYPDAGIIEQLRLTRLRDGPGVEAVATPTRFAIPIGDRHPAREIDIAPRALCQERIELPRIDYSRRAGKEHRYVWGAATTVRGNFIDSVAKIEISPKGDPGAAMVRKWHSPGCYPGEAVFVRRPGGDAEDDGVLLSVVLNTAGERSFLLVLDAADLRELARAAVPHHIPFGFHGNFFANLPR